MGSPQQAATVITINMVSSLISVPCGISEATCTIIGNLIGGNKIRLARINFKMLTLINFLVNVFMATTLFINRRAFTTLFAQEEEEINKLVVEIVPFLALFYLTYFGSAFGVIIATGLQK